MGDEPTEHPWLHDDRDELDGGTGAWTPPGEMTATDGGEADVDREDTAWKAYQKKTPTWAIELPTSITVRTEHGLVEALPGDYLCVDAEGELYPCAAETFEAQYEPMEDDP